MKEGHTVSTIVEVSQDYIIALLKEKGLISESQEISAIGMSGNEYTRTTNYSFHCKEIVEKEGIISSSQNVFLVTPISTHFERKSISANLYGELVRIRVENFWDLQKKDGLATFIKSSNEAAKKEVEQLYFYRKLKIALQPVSCES